MRHRTLKSDVEISLYQYSDGVVTLSVTTFSIMTLSIMTLFATLSITSVQHNDSITGIKWQLTLC
jgi:hypothetical protein